MRRGPGTTRPRPRRSAAVRPARDHWGAMGHPRTPDMAQRLQELESLLRRLDRCESATQAAALVGESLPSLAGACSATLLVCCREHVVASDRTGREWAHLAAASLASCTTRCAADERDLLAVAVPIHGVTGPAGVLVLVRPCARPLEDGEAGVVRLFVDHAGVALRRVSASTPVG